MAQINALQQALSDIGLWNLDVDGRYRYRYRLTDGEFILTDEMKEQLDDIGVCVAAAQRASIDICSALEQKRPNYTGPESAIYQALRASCEGYPLVLENVTLSPLVKVDLMWDGDNFQIAEIDTYNPRGIAYALWLRYVHEQAGDANAERTTIVDTLKDVLAGDTLVWLYSARERYYMPVMKAAAQILAEYDVKLRVVAETDLRSVCPETGEGLLSSGEKLLIVPDRMHKNPQARDAAIGFALNHPERLVVPYAPHMGSKLLLSLLTNRDEYDVCNGLLSTLLTTHEQQLIDRFIPRAAIVAKRFCINGSGDALRYGPKSVLKAISSSGTKGVYMPGNIEYDTVLEKAMKQKRIGYIAQSCVNQQPIQIAGENHYVRVTAYVDARNGTCLDAELTGTGNDPLVHGGENCIMLPAIF